MQTFVRTNLLFFIFILSSVFVFSCGKRKPIENTATCKASTADTSFFIQEKVGVFDSVRLFATDTIIASRELIYFSARDTTADEYTWSVGTDPRTFSGKALQLMFDQPYGTLDVKLVQKRMAANPCFGKLPTEVTYTRRLTVVGNASQLPITGNYYGYNLSDTTKKFTVSVLQNGVTGIPFPTGKDYNFRNEVSMGSTAFYLWGTGTYDPGFGAYATEGFGYLKEGNRILQIDYFYKMPTANGSTPKKDTFIGVKQ